MARYSEIQSVVNPYGTQWSISQILKLQNLVLELESAIVPAGASTTVIASIVATDSINAFDPVTITGHLASSSNISRDFGRVIGLASTSISVGFAGNVIVEGIMTNPSWSWTPGATVFLNGTGLSQTPAGSGFSQEIGIANSANVIYVDVSAPILL